MFSKHKTHEGIVPATTANAGKSNGIRSEIPSIIASDLKIVGNLMCGGSIEIEGEIEGNVTCGQVTIRRTGTVKGDVTAEVIQVDGEINGLVKGRDIVLAESGRVTGVIMYESLSVKDGAYIDGQCKGADRLHRGNVQSLDADNSTTLPRADKVPFLHDRKEEKAPVN